MISATTPICTRLTSLYIEHVIVSVTVMLIAFGVSNANAKFVTDGEFSIWQAVGGQTLIDSPLNPGNQVYELPRFSGSAEFRAEVKAKSDPLEFRGRPRFLVSASQFKINDDIRPITTKSKIRWAEATGSLNFGSLLAPSQNTDEIADPSFLSSVTATYGLQNFQWGPSESYSPSNKIFSDPVQFRSTLYEIEPRYLFRLNYVPSQTWSEVFMAEISEISGSVSVTRPAEEKFTRKILLKSEVSSSGGENYLGVVTGFQPAHGFWVGPYANYALFDSISIYLDGRTEMGSNAWYPVSHSSSEGVIMELSKKDDHRLYSYATLGSKIAFENGNDLRGEVIVQEGGYKSQELTSIYEALQSQELPNLLLRSTNSQRFSKNGLDLLGRTYAYLSFRAPDAFKIREFQLFSRWLVSLQDGSSDLYLSAEKGIGNSGTVFCNASTSLGRPMSFLRSMLGQTVTVGYRHSF